MVISARAGRDADLLSIGDYGLIGDCRTAALVSAAGSIDWLCLPNFDGPFVFGRLLDPDAGGWFSIHPDGEYQARQSYVPGTNVLETIFTTPGGAVRLTDFMPVPTPDLQRRVLFPLRQVFRCVEGLSGTVEMEADCQPRPNYGLGGPSTELRSPHVAVVQGRGWVLQALSETAFVPHGSGVRSRFRVQAGERLVLSVGYDEEMPAVFPALGPQAWEALESTVHYWRGWLDRCAYRGPYSDAVYRSALALKLLEFAPSGAIIAAPTAALPERIGGVRNWDYRFCWLRDAGLTLIALQDLGYLEEARAFLDWMLHSTRLSHPRLHVAYTVFGELMPPERHLVHLRGYRDSQPVRIGNWARDQFQLDVYGEVLDGVFRTDPDVCRESRDVRGLIAGAADVVAAHWREPDHGIWEMGAKAHFVHSKAMCWLALDRADRLLEEDEKAVVRRRGWREAKEEIERAVLDHGYNKEVGAFTQTMGGRDLDAALLLLPLVGFIDARDPRMRSTVEAVRRELTVDGLVHRYRADDGLPPGEGAFAACSFWLAHCLALQGDASEARAVFEGTLRYANHLGLMSEEIDPQTGEVLGNFPQGLTHIALINAALAIARAEAGATTASTKEARRTDRGSSRR